MDEGTGFTIEQSSDRRDKSRAELALVLQPTPGSGALLANAKTVWS
jgi:hypothetical protein